MNRDSLRIVPVTADAQHSVLRLEGELVLATAEPLRERLRTSEHRTLTLDLSGLRFTDSTGLATLIEGCLHAPRRGAQLRIRGARGQTRALLVRTGLLARFGHSAP